MNQAPLLEISLTAAVACAESTGQSLWSVFLEQECHESGRTRASLLDLMAARLMVMRRSHLRGLEQPQQSRSGLLKGGAHALHQWGLNHRPLLGLPFTQLNAGALAVGEVNACMGRVVAAPTAGSCGVLPAVLFTAAQQAALSEDQLVQALFTAGGIGLVIERKATLSGAEGGCQAEVGSASAMAAGALTEVSGGSPRQVEHAVALALGNLLGLICDPVKGLVEVPCVSRNALGASNAVLCAEMALAGIESPFRADAVIETMGRVGRRLPEDFRETARGGLAALPLEERP